MNPLQSTRDISALSHDAISYTMSSLAAHMDQCERARSPWFSMQAKAELAHAVVSPRLVTCGAVVAICCAPSTIACRISFPMARLR